MGLKLAYWIVVRVENVDGPSLEPELPQNRDQQSLAPAAFQVHRLGRFFGRMGE
jgi:hypothetical protein